MVYTDIPWVFYSLYLVAMVRNYSIRLSILAVLVALQACSVSERKQAQALAAAVNDSITVVYKPFIGKVVHGDFNGDDVADTVREGLIALGTRLPIDSFPDPEHIVWDSLVVYSDKYQFCSVITISGGLADTLYAGRGLGFYVLLNIGDVNGDGSDDLALVHDLIDFSNLNTCRIYSLCTGRWRQVKQFSVTEDAFTDMLEAKPAVFDKIPAQLEQYDNRWFYRDYTRWLSSKDTSALAEKILLAAGPCK